MCGRYNFTAEESAEIRKIIQEINDKLSGAPIKTREIFPTNYVPILTSQDPTAMLWGFPHFRNAASSLTPNPKQ